MSQHELEVDVKAQVERSLRLMLEYLIAHAHLRELFGIQEVLARHAADVAWYQHPRVLGAGPPPQDVQEMPAELRAQLAEIERQRQAMVELQHAAPDVLIGGRNYAPQP